MLPDLGWLGESKRVQTPKKKKKEEGRSFRYSPIVTVTTAMFANESYVRLNDESQRERESTRLRLGLGLLLYSGIDRRKRGPPPKNKHGLLLVRDSQIKKTTIRRIYVGDESLESFVDKIRIPFLLRLISL